MRSPFQPAPAVAPTGALTYRPDIDGLRAVAVMAVVLHHLMPNVITGGYVGVDVFFVISGYLITSIILREVKAGTFSFAHFYDRRIKRLFPALFAMLAVTLVASWFILLPSDYRATFRGALGTVFFSSNFVFWRMMEAGYFAADAKLNPLLHTWSLGVEEQFYLLFPAFLLLCVRYAKRYMLPVIAAGAIVSLVASAVLIEGHQVAIFFLSPFRVWELLAGAILAFNVVPAVQSRVLREAVAWAGLAAIGVATFWYDTQTLFPGFAALAPVLGAVAILHANASGQTFAGELLRLRPMVYVGLISYSLYLWHWPLIVLARMAVVMDEPSWFVPALLSGSLVLGCASYHWIERPFRSGGLLSPTRPYTIAFAGIAALALVCVLGLTRHGYPERFDPAVVALDASRSPVIPYIACDASAELCRIGAPAVEPTILFWGDSHMLAWAPALDSALLQTNQAALMSVNSACPPLLGVDVSNNVGCRFYNERLLSKVMADKGIDTIVLGALWSSYFNDSQVQLNQSGTASIGNPRVAPSALKRTVGVLAEDGRRVIVLGPVPTYIESIPFTAALARSKGTVRTYARTLATVRHDNVHFYKAIEQLGEQVQFVDVAWWLCRPECHTERGGVSLYRDGNHLSEDGAMFYVPDLVGVLGAVSRQGESVSLESPYGGAPHGIVLHQRSRAARALKAG